MGEHFEIVSKAVETKLPPILYGFGYGSGVIPQAGYLYSKDKYPLIDLILVVDNLSRWHKENLIENPKFYTGNLQIILRTSLLVGKLVY